ncbi:hypothetical protein BDW59DRAFT_167924 [Aspergillus cavernicola]|uniref:Ndc10 domain-containing protein n=1 Tax=Aspergillus cavernicola TaxID=176166 RepID=A0ABR4H8Y6_9EURO
MKPMELLEECWIGLGDPTDDRRDIAGQGFLRLLKLLRPILLQDSVLQMAKFPSHPIWTDPIFHRDDFKAFRQQLEQSISRDTEQVQIRRVVPAVADQLSQLRETVLSQVEQSKREVLEKLAGFDDSIQGHVPFILSPMRNGPLSVTAASALTRPGAGLDIVAGVGADASAATTKNRLPLLRSATSMVHGSCLHSAAGAGLDDCLYWVPLAIERYSKEVRCVMGVLDGALAGRD